jgi:hypothetical protein
MEKKKVQGINITAYANRSADRSYIKPFKNSVDAFYFYFFLPYTTTPDRFTTD